MGHNEIRNTFEKIMQDVFYVFEIEPTLQLFKGSRLYTELLALTKTRDCTLKRMAYRGPGSAVVF